MKRNKFCFEHLILISFLSLIFVCGQRADAQTKETPPFLGAWQWLGVQSPTTGELSTVGNGRLILTKNYVCAVFGNLERPAPEGDNPTVAESATLFHTMRGSSCASYTTTKNSKEWNWKVVHVVTANPAMVGSIWKRVHWVDGPLMYGQFIRNDGSRRNADVYLRRSGEGISPLAGAWELVSEEWDGMLIMIDYQYRYVMALKDRPPLSESGELNDADAATLYNSFDAQGGSFTVSKSNMIWRPEIAKDPREQYSEILVGFTLDDHRLVTRRSDNKLTWKRLE